MISNVWESCTEPSRQIISVNINHATLTSAKGARCRRVPFWPSTDVLVSDASPREHNAEAAPRTRGQPTQTPNDGH